ncbi:neuronal PAS domain-containing protein 3-like [Lacerta agilis]|uniref:neuronal PAS domain-containing protein 3-like n=1 Tax=Lacerta agilis TaxID=80427 RepID=UPI00141A33E5|nr:neuronal PAS domain-containing protein 3-like [Lacerta agilis]
MAALYGSEVKCVSVEWDFLQGLLVKNQPVPCLQALRKEKSRNAARSRRGKENFEFYELAKMLPLPGAITSQLDKASIVRLTISYLKMRDFANHGDPPWTLRAEGPSPPGKAAGRRNVNTLLTELFEQHLGGHILQSLDGFVFALNQEGKFLYISETVSIYLGLSQVELTGSSIFDYVHPGDHPEVAEQLGLKPPSETSHSTRQKAPVLAAATSSSGLTETSESDQASSHPAEGDALDRSFFIRLKSTLTKRGLHVKTSGYKVNKPECKSTVLDIFQLPGIPARQTEAVEVGPEFKGAVLSFQGLGTPEELKDCLLLRVSALHAPVIFSHQGSLIPMKHSGQYQGKDFLRYGPDLVAHALPLVFSPPSPHLISLSESSLAKESSQGRKLYSPSKRSSLAEAFPRSVAEAGARCRLAETDSSGPETSYREEELSDAGAGSDTEGPPSKRIKLEFQPESPPREAKEASSEESDSGSESELGLLSQQRAPLARKANGCKAGERRSAGPGRPCTSEFASVIQTQNSSVLKASPALSIKSEQPPGAKGAPWTCPAAQKGSPYTVNKALSLEKSSLRPASSHLYVSIPDSVLTPPEMESGAPKGPFGTSPRTIPAASSSADTLSPPLSGSPCEERATSTPFTPLLYPADIEVLQRFHAGNVVVPLVHQLSSPHASTSGSQGLYATSTIRYAPADMTLGMQSNMLPPSHPINLMDIGSAEAKTSRELMYHHLQRLNMVAPFGNSAGLAQISGGAFAATDSLFSTLPFSMAGSGVHGASALERKED